MQRSNGGSRGLIASAMALTAALLLGGCSQPVSVPEATPVAGKLCAVSDSAGFDDQGLNRELYIALQKAKVSWGVPLALYSLKPGASHHSAQLQLTQLVQAKCTLILASGDFLSDDVYQVALANQDQQFVIIDHHFERTSGGIGSHTMMPSNLHYVANEIAEPAFLAGYLTAMSSQTNFVAVLPAIGSASTSLQAKLDKAFRAGVAYYSSHGGKLVQIQSVDAIPAIAPASAAIKLVLQGLVDSGVDRVFVLSAKDFETVAAQSEEFKDLQLVGVERDWALVKSTKKYASRILASVVRAKNIDAITQYLDIFVGTPATTAGGSLAIPALLVNDLNNEGAVVTEAHDIAYPAGYQSAIEPLKALLTSDQGMTK
ncbi:MAG: hypothetical protein RLZZ164_424 [Actinomycetota bacterium]